MAVMDAIEPGRKVPEPRRFEGGGGVTIDAPPEMWVDIQRLAHETQATPEQVVVRALGLFAAAVEAAQRGQKVGFADTADALTREVVGLIPAR